MKKIYSFLAIATTLFMCSACNNEWEDELYTQMVSLKAPYENQGVTNIYLRYKPNGEVTYKLPVIVSGSKVNEQNLDVHLGVDNDTLKLKTKVSKKYEMIGHSDALNHIRIMIDKVAVSDARVLITGPNGCGKELVAHQLHEKSHRNDRAFIEVNCAAIPSELIESELFGHEKGSFTSAIKQKKGKFELASGGTLFLDEIGDMSLEAQAKVLRALQENKISRIGSDTDIQIDVRVIAATNKNLKEEIAKGRFREDLYHRLSVIIIEVPPLKDRPEDIDELVTYFLETICNEMGIAQKNITPEALQALKSYEWTGNIRELRNVVERLIILGSPTITAEEVSMYK